ncbi:hypothetical protein QCA50_003657 [Cerrena zonata]|uniref:DUF6534 domain-containing protein n=1 Tax=Cerrena zonata TaxID=2478898 RepID=A0AAW0GWS0_9APHY
MAHDPSSVGAILIGALLALFLSGVVSMQVVVYFEVYRTDRSMIKYLVIALWMLDLAHSALLCDTAWIYLIRHRTYDDPASIISWTIVFLQSSIMDIEQSQPVSSFSDYGPKLFASIYGNSVELSKRDTWDNFFHVRAWLFTIGLAASVELASTGMPLQIKTGSLLTLGASMDAVIRTLTRFTIETGALTSVVVIVTLVLWLSMPHNQIFLALYFTISKLYTNAFLATLNARKVIQHRTRASSSSLRGGLPTPQFMDVRTSQINTRGSSSTAREFEQDGHPRKGFRASIQKVFYRHVEDITFPETAVVTSHASV